MQSLEEGRQKASRTTGKKRQKSQNNTFIKILKSCSQKDQEQTRFYIYIYIYTHCPGYIPSEYLIQILFACFTTAENLPESFSHTQTI